MADRHDTGIAQIVFRFAQQVGMVPLTGTTNRRHMEEDLRCERFTLTEDEVRYLETGAV
jgi:diketogulonate reductase-like aldo/keto reductase